jgi:hypothetical protein
MTLHCELFADDLKQDSIIEVDADVSVQSNLYDLYTWSEAWQLDISLRKCNVMYVGKRSSNANMFLYGHRG